MKQAFMNWSGGKDATFSLYHVLQARDFQIRYLLTTVSAADHRISMHGVREELLREQSCQIGIPLKILYLPEQADMEAYNAAMQAQLQEFSEEGIAHAIFGDIFLDDLRKYREEQLARFYMHAVFPLWEMNTRDLIHAFLAAGFKAVVTCVNARLLDKSFAGRMIDEEFIRDLPPEADPCGENGEFHSFVYDGPVFREPVKFIRGEVAEKTYRPSSSGDGLLWDNRFYFCDLLPQCGKHFMAVN